VTESDLREASSSVNQRIDGARRRNRRRTVVIGAAAAIVLAAGSVTAIELLDDDDAATRPAAPAPAINDPDSAFLTGAAPTPELIRGVWRLNDGGVLVNFGPNGTVRFDEQGTLFSHPVTTGTYTVDGDVITVTITRDEQSGCVGKAFPVRSSLPGAGTLRFVSSQQSFGACSPMPLVQGEWQQALPTRNQEMAGYDNSKERGWHPLSGKTALYGVFLAGGGGHLLEIDRDGSYYVAAGSGKPVDRGQWSLHGSDLTLTSSARSAECSKGDKLVLGTVEEVNPGTNVIRGSVRQNTCSAAWTPAEWIMIPHVGS